MVLRALQVTCRLLNISKTGTKERNTMNNQGPSDEMWMEALNQVGKKLQSPEFAQALKDVDRILDEAESGQ